jgi:HSP20 family protein
MNLMRWEPFETMDLMFNCFPSFFRFGRPQLETGEYFDWSPATDISETDKEYLIRAALPAVKKGKRM